MTAWTFPGDAIMNRRNLSLAWAALLLAFPHVLAAESPQPNIEYLPFKLPEGHFQCELPKHWGVIRDKHEEERTHCFGVYTFGPKQDAARLADPFGAVFRRTMSTSAGPKAICGGSSSRV